MGDGDDVLVRFAGELRRLREQAGRPSYRELGARAHVSASALSAAAGGRKLPSLTTTLAYVRACDGNVAEWETRWHAVAAELTPAEPVPDTGRAPYVGLSAFQESDADLFFGRKDLVESLVRRVRDSRIVAVVGASGTGKTSLLRAGLLPALRDHTQVTMAPGPNPVEECAIRFAPLLGSTATTVVNDLTDPRALHRLVRQAQNGAQELLLVVDQFEEIFTLCTDHRERVRFIELLTTAAAEPNSRIRVVLGIRADFYEHCGRHAELVRVLQDHQVVVGPMSGADLRDAITQPAVRAGCSVESALLATLCAKAEGQAGVLPLLSHVLRETWRRRRGNALSLAGYQASGGIDGALQQTAEAVYTAFGPRQRRVAADLFLRLTALGDGTADTKRRITRAELDTPDPDTAVVVERLTAARLLTLDVNTVEIAHEALIRSWPRLRRWLAEDRESVHLRRRLTEAATDWNDHHRDRGLLYRGARLTTWDSHPDTTLNEVERAFLAASRADARRHAVATRRRRSIVVAALGCALVLVSALAARAAVESDRLAEERDRAAHGQQVAAARAELTRRPEVALELAVRAFDTSPSAGAAAVLRQAVADSRVRATRQTNQKPLSGLAFSPDGERVATAGRDGSIRLWHRDGDVLGAKPVVLADDTPVTDLAVSPDGRLLAAAGADGTVSLWNVDTGAVRRLREHDGRINAVAFSPDGRGLATGGDDGFVRVWDLVAARPPVALAGPGRVLAVAFSPDGSRLAVGTDDRTVRLWPVENPVAPEVLTGHAHHVTAVAYSPDGDRLASAGGDGTLRLWDLTGDQAPTVLDSHTSELTTVSFSPDGRTVATGGNDGAIRLWSVTARTEPFVLRGHSGGVSRVSFSPDGDRLASAGADGTLRLWAPTGSTTVALPDGHRGPAMDMAATPDGTTVVSGGYDGAVHLWRTNRSATPTVFAADRGVVLGVAVSADGGRVAALAEERVITVWDTATGRAVLTAPADPDALGVALRPDGRLVASTGPQGSVRLWHLDDPGRPRDLLGHEAQVRRVSFTQDGRRAVSTADDGTLRVWDTDTGEQVQVLSNPAGTAMWSAEFSQDGTRIVAGAQDGTVLLWDISTAKPTVLRGHEGMIWDVAYSPDGQWIATTGSDKTVRFWPTTGNHDPIVLPWSGPMAPSVTYGANAQHLISAHADGLTRLWVCEPCAPIDHVRALAVRRTER